MSWTMRTTPMTDLRDVLNEFDAHIRNAFERIVSFSMTKDEWNVASFPTRKGGVGLRPAVVNADAAYVASRRSCFQLCCRLDPHFLWEASHQPAGPLARAIDAINKRLPSGKQLSLTDTSPVKQHTLAAAMEAVRFVRHLSQSSTEARAHALATSAPHAGAWLTGVPSPSMGLWIPPDQFRIAMHLWLGVPVCEGDAVCPMCTMHVPDLGLHAIKCKNGGDITLRHNHLRDIVWRLCKAAGLRPEVEKFGLLPGTLSRPADVWLPRYPGGGPAKIALDQKVTSPLQRRFMQQAGQISLAAAEAYADTAAERHDCEAACAARGITFIPFVAEAFGGWGYEAQKALKVIAAARATRTGLSPAQSLEYAYQQLGTSLWASNALSVLTRLEQPSSRDAAFLVGSSALAAEQTRQAAQDDTSVQDHSESESEDAVAAADTHVDVTLTRRPEPAAGAPLLVQTRQQRLEAFYSRHDPTKMCSIPDIIARAEELDLTDDELFSGLQLKYDACSGPLPFIRPAQAAEPHPGDVDVVRLARMPQEQQKNVLGAELLKRMPIADATRAAEVTGQLLERDNSELVNLLDRPDLLLGAVAEIAPGECVSPQGVMVEAVAAPPLRPGGRGLGLPVPPMAAGAVAPPQDSTVVTLSRGPLTTDDLWGLRLAPQGLRLLGCSEASAAARSAEVRGCIGMVITHVNDQPMRSVNDLPLCSAVQGSLGSASLATLRFAKAIPREYRPQRAPLQAIPQGITDWSRLALMNREQRNNALGDQLFSLICNMGPVYAEHATKLTAALLERDHGELISMIQGGLVSQAVPVAAEVQSIVLPPPSALPVALPADGRPSPSCSHVASPADSIQPGDPVVAASACANGENAVIRQSAVVAVPARFAPAVAGPFHTTVAHATHVPSYPPPSLSHPSNPAPPLPEQLSDSSLGGPCRSTHTPSPPPDPPPPEPPPHANPTGPPFPHTPPRGGTGAHSDSAADSPPPLQPTPPSSR
eukprot:gene57021-biopygen95700